MVFFFKHKAERYSAVLTYSISTTNLISGGINKEELSKFTLKLFTI